MSVVSDIFRDVWQKGSVEFLSEDGLTLSRHHSAICRSFFSNLKVNEVKEVSFWLFFAS